MIAACTFMFLVGFHVQRKRYGWAAVFVLLTTGDRELIEDSWWDSFWGWGADQRGQNMLGKLWMKLRAELRENTSTTEPTCT